MKIRLDNVRIVYPNLFTPKKSSPDAQPAYNACFIFPKGGDVDGFVKGALANVSTDKWGKDSQKNMLTLLQTQKTCLRDGDLAGYQGFEGMSYVSANNKGAMPIVCDQNRNHINDEGVIQGGYWVNAIIDIWAQDNVHGKRLNATLLGVQLVRKDALLGGNGVSEDDFDIIPVDPSDTDSLADLFA